MNIYPIDIPVGFSGTVEVSEGQLKPEFPTANMNGEAKRYTVNLLPPEKKNIEFDLIKFPKFEWCEYPLLQLKRSSALTPALRQATKNEIYNPKL